MPIDAIIKRVINIKKIIYMGYYDTDETPRNNSPASVTMMDYVASAISRAGYHVEILSPAQASQKLPAVTDEKNGIKINFVPSQGASGKLAARIKNRIFREVNLFRALNQLVKPGECLVVYHSLALIPALSALRKVKKFRLILQVNEIYADVKQDAKALKKEMKWLNKADGYLFSTENLRNKVECSGKQTAVCYGTYLPEKILNQSPSPLFEKDKIHVVYAGTFDPDKGGISVIDAVPYLPEQYHLHVCGFGTSSQVENAKRSIEEIAQKSTAKITYDGCLRGNDYLIELQRCQIGMSSQNPKNDFNASSFPSKVLSYMANGLQVVSVDIPVIRDSAVGKYMVFYKNPDPESIAEAIQKVNLESAVNPREVVSLLDDQFIKQLKLVLG